MFGESGGCGRGKRSTYCISYAGDIYPEYAAAGPDAFIKLYIHDGVGKELEDAHKEVYGTRAVTFFHPSLRTKRVSAMATDIKMMNPYLVPEFGMYRSMVIALGSMQERFDARGETVQVADVYNCLQACLNQYEDHSEGGDLTIPHAVHTYLKDTILGPVLTEEQRPAQWTDLKWKWYKETHADLVAIIDVMKERMTTMVTLARYYFMEVITQHLPGRTWQEVMYGPVKLKVLMTMDIHSVSVTLAAALIVLSLRRMVAFKLDDPDVFTIASKERRRVHTALRYLSRYVFGALFEERWTPHQYGAMARDLPTILDPATGNGPVPMPRTGGRRRVHGRRRRH